MSIELQRTAQHESGTLRPPGKVGRTAQPSPNPNPNPNWDLQTRSVGLPNTAHERIADHGAT